MTELSISTYKPVFKRNIGGKDWSGLSFDPHSGRMFAIRNSRPRIVELDSRGGVLRKSPRLDLKDPEDLAIYASNDDAILAYVVEERPNRLALLSLERRTLATLNIWRWNLGPSKGNRGPEGVTIDWVRGELYIVYEKPPRMVRISLRDVDPNELAVNRGELVETPLDGVKDASGITWTPDGLFLLSDDSRCVVHLSGARERLALPHRQAEGLAFDGNGRLWVIGEPDELVVFEARSDDEERPQPEPSELLPPGKAPTDVGIGEGLVAEIFALFDATKSSKRHYDWTNRLDGITFWCAHWHQGKGAKVFSALSRDVEAWAAFVRRAAELGIDEEDLVRLKTRAWWEQFDRNEHRVYDEEPWVPKLLAYAGRDRVVATWQLAFWAKDVLEDALDDCERAGIRTKGGIAAMASACSSAGSWSSKLGKRIADGGTLKFGGGRWAIDPLPDWVRPEQRQDYLALVVWRAYATAKGKLRSRMRAIWTRFYDATWGPLPAPREKRNPVNWAFRPRHRGVSMELA